MATSGIVASISRLESTNTLLHNKIASFKEEIVELQSLINEQKKSKLLATLKSESESLEIEVMKTLEELIKLQKRGLDENNQDYILPSAYRPTSRIVRNTRNRSDEGVDFGRLDLRVGYICQCDEHPNATDLFITLVDVGAFPKVFTIVSALRKYETAQELFLRPVIVLCNIKPVKIQGVESQGMILCAMGNNTVEALYPPHVGRPGDFVVAGSYEHHPDTFLNESEQIFETVIKDLYVNADKQLFFKNDIPVIVMGKAPAFPKRLKNKGNVVTKKVANCSVGLTVNMY